MQDPAEAAPTQPNATMPASSGATAGLTRRLTRRVLAAVLILAVLFFVWPRSLGGRFSYVRVRGHSMLPTYHDGDLVVVWREGSYHPGDIIVFHVNDQLVGPEGLVVHRVVSGDGYQGYVTKGDNNPSDDPWHPHAGDVLGRSLLHIPHGGEWMSTLRQPWGLAIVATVVSL